jgi:hypothetical protein
MNFAFAGSYVSMNWKEHLLYQLNWVSLINDDARALVGAFL